MYVVICAATNYKAPESMCVLTIRARTIESAALT